MDLMYWFSSCSSFDTLFPVQELRIFCNRVISPFFKILFVISLPTVNKHHEHLSVIETGANCNLM